MFRLIALFASVASALRLRQPDVESMLPDGAGLPSAHKVHESDTYLANHLPTDFEVSFDRLLF